MRAMARENWAVELTETAELFRTTVENLPINLVLYDRGYRILYMNPMLARTCATVYGRKVEELVGLRGPELWPKEIWEPLLAHTEQAIGTRERQTYELTTNLPNHGFSVREWTVVPLVDSTGEVTRIVTMSTDVTAQRRMLEELRLADQRKSEFIAVLSHELRNPLAAIRLSLQVLEESAPGTDRATDVRNIIDRQVGQLVHLVDDLLDVTRITQKKIRLQRKRLDLNELVRATIADNRRLLERSGVRVEAHLASGPVHVEADAVRIAQVLTNLLANAVKFTPAGGTATVSIAADADGSAVLKVSDNGAGIGPQLLPRLFEPFMQDNRTTARSGGGLGLGLALVKGLVELHGGTVSARSAGEGRGSEFEVRLPLDVRAVAEAGGVSQAPARAGHRLLVVEDDEDIATAMRMVLEMAGHRVAVAKTGRDAIALAHGFMPELVLCDIGLPDIDGHQVARAIRADETLRSTFLVALSGYAQAEDVERARAAGFDEHLAKPPNMEKVQRMLATLG